MRAIGKGAESLRHGVLSTLDLAGTSAAVVAPAYSIYTTAAFIVIGVGIGSPLVVLFAGLAFLCYGNSAAQFARKIPSAGSTVAFFGVTFGGVTGSAVAFTMLLTGFASSASVAIVPGWWTAVAVQALFGVRLAWWIPYLVIFWSCLGLAVVGVKVSTRIAVNLMILEIIILLAAGIVAVISDPGAISGKGFVPGNVSGGLSGLGLAFPLAFYMYLGADTNVSLSDETKDARRRQPLVIYGVIIGAILLYTFLTWAPAVGYGWNLAKYSAADFPLLDVVQAHFGPARFLLYLAGWTSSIALLIAGMNAQPRIMFRAAREGMLPRSLGYVHQKWRTPVVAAVAMYAIVFVIALILGLTLGPESAFGYTASAGSVATMIIYLGVSVSVMVFYWRDHRGDASAWRHGVVPVLGCLCLVVPLYSLIKPGSPLPNSLFPYISLAVIVAGIGYGLYLKRSGREMVPGTILAESEPEPAVVATAPDPGPEPGEKLEGVA
jgi:amino acid transporter